MKRLSAVLVTLALLASLGVLTLQFWPLPPPGPIAQANGDVKRGAYLARLSGCITCHTAPGAEPLSGGAALVSRFGSFYAPNITPDPESGIGSWTFEQFVRAVRQGVSPSGEPYYPAFPYEFYATLTDQDMADLWAALQATPAVDRPSTTHAVPFPFSVRAGVKLWRTFFERPATYVTNITRSAGWNRGRYLVWGPAHCAACHTPRNIVGGLPDGQVLSGDPSMQDGQASPPLTVQALTARGYTKEGMIQALRTGITPDGDAFGGSMAEVVHQSTKFLLNQHLEDMATYLLDLDDN
ncbi:cytochrome C [Devosia soli]|uniref:Cytochrome C n=1 Tax=Devosia soli TaxID=361041 RepID=A0A0F5L4Y8_9HYPH|nr:cytochrome c [Devosia soli]KKB77476.1 cytochrome C [Devosia soli]